MKCYVAVTSDNKWLAYGYFQDSMQVLEEAKKSGLYQGDEQIYIFEVTHETVWDSKKNNFRYFDEEPSDSLGMRDLSLQLVGEENAED